VVTEEGIREAVRQALLPLCNSWYFLTLYANAAGGEGQWRTGSNHVLDRYVLAKLHDLAADVAGVLEALDCGPAHLVGHAFGNRVARCLAADRPSLVRSVTLLAAGGLVAPSTPIGTHFGNATEVKMNGSDCVTVLGARWLSPASDPKILAHVECWPAVLLAHLATSRGMALEDWWGAGTAPLLVIQGLDDTAAPPGNGHALREQFGERVRVIDLPRAGHFLLL